MWILCLAEDSLETSSLIFSEKKTMKKYLWMSSAAVVTGALRVINKTYKNLDTETLILLLGSNKPV